MLKLKSSTPLLCMCAALAFSCMDEPVEKTKVTFRSSPGSQAEIILSTYHYFNLEQTVLDKKNLDLNGSVTFDLTLETPLFVYYKMAADYGGLLLEPGDDLTIALPERKFSGKGRVVNEFISSTHTIASRYDTRGMLYGPSSPQMFQNKMDSLELQLREFKSGYFDTTQISDQAKQLLTALHDLLVLNYYQYYVLVRDNEQTVLKDMAPLRERVSKMPLDNRIKNALMVEYGTALQLYGDLQITRPIAKLVPEQARTHHPEKFLKIIADSLITSKRYTSDVKELFLAKAIDNGIATAGITPLMDSLYTVYKARFSESPYKPFIQKRFDKWAALAPGQPAPNFYGVTMTGDTVSISDLEGNVVYIDVWATWCAPCVSEFPASIALRQKFQHNDNLVFMYVSIDQNTAAWEKFIVSHPNLQGVHIIDKNSSLSEPYLLAGVPRYILIDADGNIINSEAPRPSSGEVEQLLAKALSDL